MIFVVLSRVKPRGIYIVTLSCKNVSLPIWFRLEPYLVGDAGLVTATGEDGCLVEEVSQVSTRESWHTEGHLLEVHVRQQLLVASVHLQDLLSALHIWHVNRHLYEIQTEGEWLCIDDKD